MIAFFDVDHTLLRGSSARHFLMAGIRRRRFPVTSLRVMPLVYLRFWKGRLPADPAAWEFPGLRGMLRSDLEELAEASFESIRRDIRPQSAALVERLRKEGREIAFATTSVDLIVAPLARYLGVREVVASRLEFSGEVATGRFAGLPLLREEKRRRVLELLDSRGIAPQACSYYTDSVNDLPLLEAVGEGVAVNPDARLARLARGRGWRILRF